MFLTAVHFTFYVGYDRYMSDIGNPGVTDALFTMLLLMSYDSLARGARWAWAVAILMATLVLYAGPVMFVLSVAAMLLWKPIPRRETLRWAATAGGLLLAAAAFYVFWGWRDGSLRYWIETLDQEYVNHYLADVPRWISAPLFLGYFVLGAGGLAIVGILAAFRRDAWQRTVATVTLLYLAIVLGSGFKNLHWLAPLWPVPLILLLRAGSHPEDTRRGAVSHPGGIRRVAWLSLLATASILVCIGACWPRQRACFTLNRELGRQTTILTDDYLSAATWARLRLVLRDQRRMGWNCDAWTWVTYSEVTSRPRELRPLVLTGGDAPAPGYWLLASRPVEGTAIVARLYCRSKQVEAGWKRLHRPIRLIAIRGFTGRWPRGIIRRTTTGSRMFDGWGGNRWHESAWKTRSCERNGANRQLGAPPATPATQCLFQEGTGSERRSTFPTEKHLIARCLFPFGTVFQTRAASA